MSLTFLYILANGGAVLEKHPRPGRGRPGILRKRLIDEAGAEP